LFSEQPFSRLVTHVSRKKFHEKRFAAVCSARLNATSATAAMRITAHDQDLGQMISFFWLTATLPKSLVLLYANTVHDF
jgi:hypothetical protein